MIPRIENSGQNGKITDFGLDINSDNLKLGEIIESRVIRVFDNGRILVDLKGNPTIATTTVPLKPGIHFNAKVRRNGRQKWLQILVNDADSDAVKDWEDIELNLLIVQVLLEKKYDLDPELIRTVGEDSKKFSRILSHPRQLVESVVYLTAIGVQVTQPNIYSARTLLGPEYLLGEKLDQIRHYIRASRRRNLFAGDSMQLSATIGKIPLVFPGLANSNIIELGLLDVNEEGADQYEKLKLSLVKKIDDWIGILNSVRKTITNSVKLNRRFVDLVEQNIRTAKSLKLVSDVNTSDHSKASFYFQIPIIYENKISTIEGRVNSEVDATLGNKSVTIEAIWRMQGRNAAHFQINSSINFWQATILTNEGPFSSMLDHEMSHLFDNLTLDIDTQFQIQTDAELLQEKGAKDLRWPSAFYQYSSVDLVA